MYECKNVFLIRKSAITLNKHVFINVDYSIAISYDETYKIKFKLILRRYFYYDTERKNGERHNLQSG